LEEIDIDDLLSGEAAVERERVNARELAGVSETMLLGLRNRAVEAARPDGRFDDPLAVETFEAIDHDFGTKFGNPSQFHSLRARCFDAVIRQFLSEHPGATVVALGEGLQTTFWRLGDPDVQWLSVDVPEAVSLRSRLLPSAPNLTTLACSALDRRWMDLVDPGRPAMITAEGLLMYLQPADALSLIADCAARFPGGRMIFDNIPPWSSRRTVEGQELTSEYTVPPMPFALSVDDAAALPDRISAIASVEDLSLPRGRRAWAVLPGWFLNAPWIRTRRPSFTLLRFAEQPRAEQAPPEQ
jgi:O-methyltransferase involved in polyketide biosynthesis